MGETKTTLTNWMHVVVVFFFGQIGLPQAHALHVVLYNQQTEIRSMHTCTNDGLTVQNHPFHCSPEGHMTSYCTQNTTFQLVEPAFIEKYCTVCFFHMK